MRTRAGHFGLIAALIFAAAAPARGQAAPPPPGAQAQPQPAPTVSSFPTWEVSGGYQLLRIPDRTLPFGLNVDGAWNLSEMLGLVAEIGWAMDSESVTEDVDEGAGRSGAQPDRRVLMVGTHCGTCLQRPAVQT